MVEASTHGGSDASLLAQHIDRYLASEDSLQTAARVHLAAILSVEESLCNLGTFFFIAFHLFSVGWWHSSAIADLLRLIEKLYELHIDL